MRHPVLIDRGLQPPHHAYRRYACGSRRGASFYVSGTAEGAYSAWARYSRAGQRHKAAVGFSAVTILKETP